MRSHFSDFTKEILWPQVTFPGVRIATAGGEGRARAVVGGRTRAAVRRAQLRRVAAGARQHHRERAAGEFGAPRHIVRIRSEARGIVGCQVHRQVNEVAAKGG